VTSGADWAGYLAAYHDANPGITEDLLAEARDAVGRTRYDWLVEAVGGTFLRPRTRRTCSSLASTRRAPLRPRCAGRLRGFEAG
jgi:hypothetical protein